MQTRTMKTPLNHGVLTTVLLLAVTGCNLDISNPGVIDADTFDPSADAPMLSMSAQQNFFQAYTTLINSTALYTGETRTGAVRQESNDIARRAIVDTNLDLNSAFWSPLQTVIATNDQVVDVLRDTPGFGTDINAARSSLWGGFGLTLLGEAFCQGVIDVGPPLTREETFLEAEDRFSQAISIAGALSDPEADRILNAARVGLARARLQRGDGPGAIQAASEVPPEFVARAIYVDDPQTRGRTGNGVYTTSVGNTQVVPPAVRDLDDPRLPYVDAGSDAQDGRQRLYRQQKYTSFSDPIPVASGLEARYIVAEAELAGGNPQAALELISERREAGGQSPFEEASAEAVLAELMDQRARDFWLEAKHLGDALRHPGTSPFVPPEGADYYKPEQGSFGPLTCLEVPFIEKANNPNFP